MLNCFPTMTLNLGLTLLKSDSHFYWPYPQSQALAKCNKNRFSWIHKSVTESVYPETIQKALPLSLLSQTQSVTLCYFRVMDTMSNLLKDVKISLKSRIIIVYLEIFAELLSALSPGLLSFLILIKTMSKFSDPVVRVYNVCARCHACLFEAVKGLQEK